jgi:hypothetical protein
MADPVFTNRPFSCSGKVWQQEPPCRYSLPRLDCHASPFFRQDLGKQQTERQRVKILYLKIHVLSRGGWKKYTLKFPNHSLTFIKKLMNGRFAS